MTHEEKLEYLENLDRETISPTELAMILGGRPYLYNVSAKDGSLTLPHIWRGRNLRVFRQPVLHLLSGGSCGAGSVIRDEKAKIIPLFASEEKRAAG